MKERKQFKERTLGRCTAQLHIYCTCIRTYLGCTFRVRGGGRPEPSQEDLTPASAVRYIGEQLNTL